MSLDFYTRSSPKARKNHECSLCHQKIPQGEPYIRFSGKYDGEFFDLSMHNMCDELIHRFTHGVGESEYTDDEVIEDISECVCHDCEQDEDCPFTFYGRAQCKKVIEEYRVPTLKGATHA